MTLKPCQLMEYSIRKIFIESRAKNVHQKLASDPFLILVNNLKQPLHARNSFKDILEEDYKKPFLLKPVPANGKHYGKQKGPQTSDSSLFRLQNKFRQIQLLMMYYLAKF